MAAGIDLGAERLHMRYTAERCNEDSLGVERWRPGGVEWGEDSLKLGVRR